MGVTVLEEPSGVVAVRLRGQVSESEWRAAQRCVADLLKSVESFPVLVIGEGFKGWGPGKWDDLSFQHQFDKQITRVAIVMEEEWETLALMFAGAGFRKLEIEYFTPAEIAKARAWLTSAPRREVPRAEEHRQT